MRTAINGMKEANISTAEAVEVEVAMGVAETDVDEAEAEAEAVAAADIIHRIKRMDMLKWLNLMAIEIRNSNRMPTANSTECVERVASRAINGKSVQHQKMCRINMRGITTYVLTAKVQTRGKGL